MTDYSVIVFFIEGNYVKRQIERWSKQYEASKTEEQPPMNRLMKWLQQNAPTTNRTSVVHGDFRSVITIQEWLSPSFYLSFNGIHFKVVTHRE